jgi:hypothetical protein
MLGGIWQNGTWYYGTAFNIYFANGNWKNGNWNGSPFSNYYLDNNNNVDNPKIVKLLTNIDSYYNSDLIDVEGFSELKSNQLHINNAFNKLNISATYSIGYTQSSSSNRNWNYINSTPTIGYLNNSNGSFIQTYYYVKIIQILFNNHYQINQKFTIGSITPGETYGLEFNTKFPSLLYGYLSYTVNENDTISSVLNYFVNFFNTPGLNYIK